MRVGPRRRQSGAGVKPLQAAVVKSGGGERCSKRRDLIPSGMVWSGEASESEPSMTCRNSIGDVKTGGAIFSRDQFGGDPEVCPTGIPDEMETLTSGLERGCWKSAEW